MSVKKTPGNFVRRGVHLKKDTLIQELGAQLHEEKGMGIPPNYFEMSAK